MGQDFLRGSAPGFKRSWRAGKEKLDQRDLFHDTMKERRTLLADPLPGATLTPGQEYILRASDDTLTVHDGDRLVARAKCDVTTRTALQGKGGFAKGVAVQVHQTSGAVDIEVK